MAIISRTTSNIRPRNTLIPRSVLSSRSTTNNCCPISDKLIAIRVEVKKIEKSLKSNSIILEALQKKERTEREAQNRKLKEKIKEKKGSSKGKGNVVTPPVGGGGILQSINQFLLMNIMGLAAPKLIQYAPQISWVIKNIIYFSRFVSIFTTEFFKNFIKSIHFAYRVYDNTRQIVKNIGGENFQKTFDDTSSLLNKFLNGAIVVALAVAGSGSDGSPGDRRKGRGRGRGPRGGPGGERTRGGRPGVTSNEDFRNPLRRRPEVTTGGEPRGRGGGRARVTVGGEAKLANSGFRSFRKILGKIEIIGPLIGFVFDLIMGEPVGRAAAGAVGSLIGAGIATALVGAGTFGIGAIAGGFIGSWLGDMIGTSLYDAVAPMLGWQVSTQAQGGAVGNKTTTVSVPTKRTKTRSRPSVKRFTKVQPGKNVGGEDAIKKLYPDPSNDRQASPYKALVKTSEILKKNSFSALMAAGVDLALGQNVDKKIFKNFAEQLNYMVESSYDPDSNYGMTSVNRQVLTAATGGKIPVGRTGGTPKSNFSDQFYDSMVSMVNMRSNDIFSEIRKNLSLTSPDSTTPSPNGGGPDGGSPNLIDNANAREVYNYFVGLGFTPEAASGILGNLLQENRAINPRQKQHGGDAMGIIQWEPARWRRLVDWANANNKDEYDLRTQLEWAVVEMKERGTYNRIKNLRDVRKAVKLFHDEMEKAGVPMMDSRYEYGANAYASFAPDAAKFGRIIDTNVIDEFKGRPGGQAGKITSERGWRWGRMHHGVDISPSGPGYFVALKLSGNVDLVEYESGGYGKYVDIKSGNMIYRFAHLARVSVTQGQSYNGQTIGEIGSTGGSTGIHLHFEVRPAGADRYGNGSVNPIPYVRLLSIGKRLSTTPSRQTRQNLRATPTNRSGGNTPTDRPEGSSDGPRTSAAPTTPQSTNIAQLAPNQSSSTSSAVTSVTSNGNYSDDVATNIILLYQEVYA